MNARTTTVANVRLTLAAGLLGLALVAASQPAMAAGSPIKTRITKALGCHWIERDLGAFFKAGVCQKTPPPGALFVFDTAKGRLINQKDGKCLVAPFPGHDSVLARDCNDPNVPAANKSWTYEQTTGFIRLTSNQSKCIHWHVSFLRIQLLDCSQGDPQVKSWDLK